MSAIGTTWPAAVGLVEAGKKLERKAPEINKSEKVRLDRALRLSMLMGEIKAILAACDQNDRRMLRKEHHPYLDLILDAYGKFVLKEDEATAASTDTETLSFDVV